MLQLTRCSQHPLLAGTFLPGDHSLLAGRFQTFLPRGSPSRSLNSTAQRWGAGIPVGQVPTPHVPQGQCLLHQPLWRSPQDSRKRQPVPRVAAPFPSPDATYPSSLFLNHTHCYLKTQLMRVIFISREQSQPVRWRSRSRAEGEMVSWMSFFHR